MRAKASATSAAARNGRREHRKARYKGREGMCARQTKARQAQREGKGGEGQGIRWQGWGGGKGRKVYRHGAKAETGKARHMGKGRQGKGQGRARRKVGTSRHVGRQAGIRQREGWGGARWVAGRGSMGKAWCGERRDMYVVIHHVWPGLSCPNPKLSRKRRSPPGRITVHPVR